MPKMRRTIQPAVLPGWKIEFGDDGRTMTVIAPEGVRLTGDLLRGIGWADAVEAAGMDSPETDAHWLAEFTSERALHRPRGGSAEFDAEVARLYRKAVLAGLTPREAIAALYGVDAQTAGKWITEAKRNGVVGSLAEERSRALREIRED
ncbi:hypothetical protein [Agromyces binzhouensis]|uniref:Uncharacterized protein n=1 Tax=Agromyces binzhouensis TaxID=1817495 RepID=A0A4Q2JRW7_9MICO|nr:hypothetical protein [Agromyces binzhouensis]RXZ49904.1 hypothetical protein ESO86_04730 [Agromyces binzhouensis]